MTTGKLGTRVAWALATALVALIALLLTFSAITVHGGFREAEDAYVRRNVQRALHGIEAISESLSRIVTDWACRDDTYAFVAGSNAAYRSSNLVSSTFSSLDVDVLAICDNRGRAVWSGRIGSDGEIAGTAPSDLLLLAAPGGLPPGSGRHGVMRVDNGIMVVAAHPILTSERAGPSRGVLIMGRSLDADEIRALSDRLLTPMALLPLASSPEDEDAVAALRAGRPMVIEISGPKIARGYALLRDLSGEPVALMRTELPRQMYRQAARTVGLFTALAVVLSTLFAVGFMFILRRQALGRIESLDAQIGRLDPRNPTAGSLSLEGADELSGLAASFNRLLGEIAESREAEEEQRRRTKRLLDQQTAINRLALALGEERRLEDIYRIVHEHVREMVDVWFFVISAYDEGGQQIVAEYAASADRTFDVSEFPPLPLGEPGAGTQSHVIHSGEPLYTPDHRAAVRDSSHRFIVEGDGSVHPETPEEESIENTTRSAVYLPMKVAGRTVGIMQLQSKRLDAYTPDDVELLAGLANVAAVAIQDARLREDLRKEVEAHRQAEEQVRTLLDASDRARATLLSVLEDERRIERDLRQSEERFALAFRTSPYAIVITRVADGSFVDVNDGFTAMTGYTREEALHSSTMALGIWADPADRNRVLAALRRGDTVRGREYRFRRKDGRIVLGLFSAHVIELGGETCVLSSVNDITARKRAEDMLRTRVRLLEHAIERSLGELLQETLDEAERLTDSSIGFYHFVEADERTISLQAWSTRTRLEYCTAEGEGRHYPIEDAGVWADSVRLRKPIVHNDYASLPERRGMPDGHAELVRELVVPIVRAGKVVAILGVGNKPTRYADEDVEAITHLADIAWEIADRKRAEERQADLQEQLNHALKMETIGRLAGGVAHDYNNMLQVILGTCDLLDGAVQRGSNAAEHLGRIRRAAERGWALTQRLLAFSRRQPVQVRVLDVNAAIRSVSDMLIEVIGEHIALDLNLTDEPARTKADPSQVEQALTNLLVNARDAMPDGGKVTIETRVVTLDEAYARQHAYVTPGRYVMLAVSDTGIGMSDAVRRRIFEPFFTTKPTGQGTGLGLASVYGMAKQLGGSVEVESEPGKGSTFSIYLPATDEEPDPTEAPPSTAELGHGELVMAIEDERPLREVMRAMLADLGYRPRVFASGKEAIAAVRDDGLRPSLIITDIVMPEMSGTEVADALHQIVPDTPILFMSGYADSATMRELESHSGLPFLAKPFTRTALARALARSLAARKVGRTILMVDDDPDMRELTEMACRRRGHTLVGVGNLREALETLAAQGFDLLLIDNNVGPASAEDILTAIRRAGCATPAFAYTGDAGSVDTSWFERLGVEAVVEKTFGHKSLLERIEAM